MILANTHPDYRSPLDRQDSDILGTDAAALAERFLAHRDGHRPTALEPLPSLARELGVASIHVKDESTRLGMGSFKALGGSYAVIRLVLEEAGRRLGRAVDVAELGSPEVRQVAATLTFGCATDGNHGRSVATGARLTGARSAIFVHSGVSDERVAAIADCGAETIRVEGTYDDSVRVAEETCRERGWIVVSDTSWPGYERIPGLVMQGYTAMFREAMDALPEPPTHVFVQAGVGGLAAALAAYLDAVYGEARPALVVVEPERAACLLESARAGRATKIGHGESTIMAMLECYEPSLVAWRILSRRADAFMTVGEDDARTAMRRLADPLAGDPAIVAGESGAAGLAALLVAARDGQARRALGLDAASRIFLLNTEGATDRSRYARIVGRMPEDVGERRAA